MSILTASAIGRAFAIDQEPAAVRDNYGQHLFGQSLLLSRRLVQAGVPIVQANMGTMNNWDTHNSNFTQLKDRRLPAPFSRRILEELIDEEAAAHVDAISYCLFTAFESDVPSSKVTDQFRWRPPGLDAAGIDRLKVLIDRCRHHGMQFIADIRMNDRHGGAVHGIAIRLPCTTATICSMPFGRSRVTTSPAPPTMTTSTWIALSQPRLSLDVFARRRNSTTPTAPSAEMDQRCLSRSRFAPGPQYLALHIARRAWRPDLLQQEWRRAHFCSSFVLRDV